MNLLVENRADLPDVTHSSGLDPLPHPHLRCLGLLRPTIGSNRPSLLTNMEVRRLGPLAESGVHVRHHLVMVQLLLAILTIYLMLLLTIHMLLVVLWMWLPAAHPNETWVVRDLLGELVGLLDCC